jgi:hypothetical protein
MEKVFQAGGEYPEDVRDVKGQEHVKQALEIAAAGGHNILLIRPPFKTSARWEGAIRHPYSGSLSTSALAFGLCL